MEYLEPFLRALIAVVAVIALTRVNGLRSFSKMTSFDFALTVATGSIIASTVLNLDQALWVGPVALIAVFAIQATISRVRFSSTGFRGAIENEPLLLVEHGTFIPENLIKANVTKGDVYGKLREANALSMANVRAVVIEPTGDISVLHGAVDGPPLEDEILTGVKRH
ncbi:DUF421 domain-containing protein [Oceaniglobus ichthyenteri]|uniref:DUF421 domain-containing protein n=1 Tax=Oceaniglobus ichthyenteri TaxID=2136177 RepID=UPI000D37F73A|nr:YetF domain-containing protein [Oceaniglobus ichthyenteri]